MMMHISLATISLTHVLMAGAVLLVLFGGRGKISEIMGDFAKGIKSFKKGLTEEDEPVTADPAKTIDHQPQPTMMERTPDVHKV